MPCLKTWMKPGMRKVSSDRGDYRPAAAAELTDEEKARILAESAEPDVNISAVARRWGVNRGLLNVWRRDAGLTSQRSARSSAQQAMFVPVTVVGDRTPAPGAPSDVAHFAAVELRSRLLARA